MLLLKLKEKTHKLLLEIAVKNININNEMSSSVKSNKIEMIDSLSKKNPKRKPIYC